MNSSYAQSAEYQELWRKLNRGERIDQEYKRVAKGGRRSLDSGPGFNPILDLNGKVYKIVNFLTEVTGRYSAVEQLGDRAE